MRLVSLGTLRAFWRTQSRPAAQSAFEAWANLVEASSWADPIGDGRIIFDVGGNKYRIVAWVDFKRAIVLVMWVGNHADYGKIDPFKVRDKLER